MCPELLPQLLDHMNRLILISAFGLAVLLAACGPQVTRPAPLSGQPAADAQATLTVYQLQQEQARQATAAAEQARAEATRQAEQSTAVAVAAVTSTAQAIAAIQTATVESLQVRATTQALELDGTRQAMALVATREAEERVGEAERQLVAAEATRLAIEAEAQRVAVERADTLNHAFPLIIAGLLASWLIMVGTVAWRWLVQARPQAAGENWVVHDKFQPVIVAPSAPRRLPPPEQPPVRLALPPGPVPTPAQPLPASPEGHVLIAGPTGSGKSTAMRAILSRREQVVVLDPHSAGDDWEGAMTIGAGRNFPAIGAYMAGMNEMLRQRYELRAGGRETFEPLTVAVDEMPAIVAELGRDIEATWRAWLREGRKVGLFLVLSTQSTRVRTLGIEGEGDILENFHMALLLGDAAAARYPDLVRGMERPAVVYNRSGAQPVIIPAAPPTAVTRPPTTGPLAVLPFPRPADPGAMTEADRQQILDLAGRGESLRTIQRRVFGYDGGAAFYAVKTVLEPFPTGSPPPLRAYR